VVYLADISRSAIQVARQNVQELIAQPSQTQRPQQIITLVSDLLSAFPSQLKFDLLVANLPYIPSQRIAYLDESVKNHEPHLALDGGPQGLTLIHRFLNQAVNYLKPDGLVLLEIDYTHQIHDLTAGLKAALPGQPKLAVQIITDSFHRQRFALITFLNSD